MDVQLNPDVISTPETVFPTSESLDQRLDTIVSDWVAWIVQIVVFVLLCGVISLGGLVANVINIIVFFRQGALSDSSNLCLLALAFADIGCLLPVFMNSVCFAIQLTEPADLYLQPVDFMEVATIWTHILFVQIASWITAYIAFERCLCVVFPFKVKQLFSAKRSLAIIAAIAIFFTASFVPTFVSFRMEDVLNPDTNKTHLFFVLTETHKEITMISDVVHAMFFRTLVLVAIFVCTQITVFRVNQSKSWRKSIGASNNENVEDKQTNNNTNQETVSDSSKNKKDDSGSNTKRPSQRERRLVRMITIISIIFMVCNLPDIVGVYLLHTVPALKHLSVMDNLFVIIMSMQFCFESINSAINILVYYNMSTRYRQEFRAWLGLEQKS